MDKTDGAVEGRCRNPDVVSNDTLNLVVVERNPLNITPWYLRGDDAVRKKSYSAFVQVHASIMMPLEQAVAYTRVYHLRASLTTSKHDTPMHGKSGKRVYRPSV